MTTRYEYSILNVCEELHMNLNNTSDTLSEQDMEMVANYLQYRLDGWTRGIPSTEKYDNAVKELMKAVLEEYHKSR